MAKRVIRLGADTYYAVCGACGTQFTYEREDVQPNLHGGRDVSCPHCGSICHHFSDNAGLWPTVLRPQG